MTVYLSFSRNEVYYRQQDEDLRSDQFLDRKSQGTLRPYVKYCVTYLSRYLYSLLVWLPFRDAKVLQILPRVVGMRENE